MSILFKIKQKKYFLVPLESAEPILPTFSFATGVKGPGRPKRGRRQGRGGGVIKVNSFYVYIYYYWKTRKHNVIVNHFLSAFLIWPEKNAITHFFYFFLVDLGLDTLKWLEHCLQKVYEIDILFSDTKTTEAASMCHLRKEGAEEGLNEMPSLL